MRVPSAILAAALAGTATAQSTPFLAGFPSPWGTGAAGSGWEEAYAKARAFVSNLTLVEKVNLTTGTGWEADVCIGNTGSIPRLGFRGFCLQDSPLGIRYTELNSAFPAGINAAATWSRDLIRRRGEAMGEEFNGKGIDIQLGPVASPLGRVAKGGRDWEGFSPDPFLTGVAMAETVKGVQSRGVIACAKHYILNEQEHFRTRINVKIDDRAMHELYLWPFADAVKAGIGSIMCSYNKINGEYSCENEWTMNYLLKNELNFQGFVMTDWGGQHSGSQSALAGLDMAMPGDGGARPYGAFWGGALTQAVLAGDVPQWRLDDMVTRIMAAHFKVRVGNYTSRPEINFSAWTNKTMGPLYPAANKTWQVVNKFVDVQANHKELIREMGAKSIVLLKNDNKALPLHKPKSIAVIGEDAQDPPGGPNACKERACIKGTIAMGYGSGTAEFPYLISPATAIMGQAQADGSTFANVSTNWDLAAAQTAASAASVAIVFANADAGENFVSIGGNEGDRNNLTLWNNGDELIKAVAAVNNNTIVVLHTPGAVLIQYAREHPNITAILWAGFPGQESGNALADVLYGKVNPQGRSPFTWAKKAEDYGSEILYQTPAGTQPEQSFDEGIFIDYRHFMKAGIEPAYEFGAGLSYTSFAFSNLSIVAHGNASASYKPLGTLTGPAPTYGAIDKGPAANMAPANFTRITPYVYPWLLPNVTAGPGRSYTAPPAAQNGSAQPLLPAGGAPGGHPGLYSVLYTISAAITNTGSIPGTEIPQLYVQLGGSDNAFSVLRGFDDVFLQPGETKRVSFELTRRDVSNWNSTSQNWEISSHDKFMFLGTSCVEIRLNATLPPVQ